MTDEELGYLPATELAGMIRAKTVSPVEVVSAIIRRIEGVEPRVNAFVTFAPDQALAAARAAEAAVMQGAALGPLHGIPATIKDLCWTSDFPTQFGSKIFAGHRTPTDNPTAARLKQAGAILLGKTATSEFGWTAVSRSPLSGITHNPWKHGTNAGASSAGAAVGAAAGYGPLHQGTDGAGSIRLPAHFCGVFGLKPSFGRVPYAPVNPGDYTSHMGPITRTVADAALMMEVMAGPHPLDHTTLEAWPAPYLRRLHEGIAGRRIAFSADLDHARVDPEVAALVRTAAERFAAAAKAPIEEVTPAWGPLGPELGRKFWSAHETRLVGHLPRWEAEMDPGLVACIRFGSQISIAEYQALRERKMAYIAAIHTWFEDWDFLLTPTASVAAFTAGQLQPADWPQDAWDWMSWAEFSYPFNMSWNPAATVPCGFTREGLPVGLQIVGRRFDDLGVLQAAAAFEQALPWAERRPALAE